LCGLFLSLPGLRGRGGAGGGGQTKPSTVNGPYHTSGTDQPTREGEREGQDQRERGRESEREREREVKRWPPFWICLDPRPASNDRPANEPKPEVRGQTLQRVAKSRVKRPQSMQSRKARRNNPNTPAKRLLPMGRPGGTMTHLGRGCDVSVHRLSTRGGTDSKLLLLLLRVVLPRQRDQGRRQGC
jgi:hypothetical protein